jgi:hypothetical protein
MENSLNQDFAFLSIEEIESAYAIYSDIDDLDSSE